ARAGNANISYYAFPATHKGKTLELFGRKAGDGEKPEPFHVYRMRQAIEEGFILDVLKNYSSYDTAYKLAHNNPTAADEVDSKRAATAVAKWLRLHPHNISQKVQVIVEHFRKNVAHLLNGEAKAMIVTGSRQEAVRYHLALQKYAAEQGYNNVNPMVAFSGEVIDLDHSPDPFTETNMNPGLKGRDMRKAFDTPEYQVMIVANKFQTGFDQPKLVAMYVDKKLGGVDCIQTLSRLNRTYPGKDSTYVLDFGNEPADALAIFRTYYQTAELAEPSDPNLVYEIMDELAKERIYQWSEVEQAAAAYFDPKVKEMPTGPFQPAVDRYRQRYRDVAATLQDAKKVLDAAQQSGNEILISNAEKSLADAKEKKDVLDTFKANLISFVRFYEFISQLVDFNDEELEKLNVYAGLLHPMLREEVLQENIDLNDVVMTHYKLKFKRQQDLIVAEDCASYDITGITASGTHKPAEQKYEPLTEILARLNEMFAGENYTDKDRVSFLMAVTQKVTENNAVMDQIRNNNWEQVKLGDLPAATQSAVIASMQAQKGLATEYLAHPEFAEDLMQSVYELIKKNLLSELARDH
ncbi:MAG: type I restriction endonuclease subunit R, partial [Gammaproteobacteria bacterium]|nr:type I restriction endonuclease subunit R [Gammaproteobacteria bacterium]